uniref:Uncharacterized protein n=1 Tax=Anguilla anguilla TaxID=7936 RepID=A0A0E9WZG1_ANGAN
MDLSRTVGKNLTGLHRTLTSTPSNTFGISWKANCKPGLIAQSMTDLTNALLVEWKQIPVAML